MSIELEQVRGQADDVVQYRKLLKDFICDLPGQGKGRAVVVHLCALSLFDGIMTESCT